jgi:hypothetical protein
MHRYFIGPYKVGIISLLLPAPKCGCFPFAPSFSYLYVLKFFVTESFVLTFVFSQILCVFVFGFNVVGVEFVVEAQEI